MALIIINSSSRVRKFKKELISNMRWVYLGNKIVKMEKMIKILGDQTRYFYADELKKISYGQREDFVNWVAWMGRRYESSLDWQLSQLASKNTYISDFYLLYCYLKLLEKWIEEKKRLIVFVEDSFLLRAISNNFKSKNVIIKLNLFWHYSFFINLVFRSFIIPWYFFSKFTGYYFINFFLKRKYDKMALLKREICIQTWIDKRSFKENNEFFDAYFNNLYKIYDNYSENLVILSQLELSRALLSRVYQNRKILPLSYFLKFSDIVRVFFKKTPNFLEKEASLRELNLLQLLKRESLIERSHIGRKNFYLHYLLYDRMFRIAKFKILIYLFENQVKEKMLLLALKNSNFFIKTVAYQHSAIPRLFLTLSLGVDEEKITPLPNVIMANGEYYQNYLLKEGFKNIENGGSLRFKKDALLESEVKAENNLLLVGSSSLEDTLKIIFWMLRELPRLSKMYKKILIKLHPEMQQGRILKYIKILPPNVEFISGYFGDIKKRFRDVVHNGTTAAIECLALKKRVFKFKSERLDIDPLDNIVQQNEIDERSDIRNFNYINYPVDVDIIYEPPMVQKWVRLLEGLKKIN